MSQDGDSNTGYGLVIRCISLVVGLVVLCVAFQLESDPRGAVYAMLIGGACLWAAITGVDLVARYSGRRIRARWVLPSHRTPPAQPLQFAVVGAVFGLIYVWVYDEQRYLLIGAFAGLAFGILRPLFRFRVIGSLIVTGVVVAIGWAAGFSEAVGMPATVFMALLFGFIYGTLFWGSRGFDPLSGEDP